VCHIFLFLSKITLFSYKRSCVTRPYVADSVNHFILKLLRIVVGINQAFNHSRIFQANSFSFTRGFKSSPASTLSSINDQVSLLISGNILVSMISIISLYIFLSGVFLAKIAKVGSIQVRYSFHVGSASIF